MSPPQPDPGEHYFSDAPSARSAERTIDLVLPEGRLIPLVTDRGMFSPDRIDDGSRALLVDGPPVRAGGTLVDVGCGYGTLSIALALRGGPDTRVWAVDVNERARDLCRRNAEANGVAEQVTVVAPDEFPDDLAVDQVWSNPPIRIGKGPLHELLSTWLGRLAPAGGEAALVVHRHLGADSLSRWLTEQGWEVERLATRGGYRILRLTSADPTPEHP